MSLRVDEYDKNINAKVESMLDWAKNNQAKAEQLAMDSARLLSCTSERMDRLSNQGFFKRCWARFSGEAGEMERANEKDLLQMQRSAISYIKMLQEEQILMAHSLLSLKNNLLSLAVEESKTKNLIEQMAKYTLERFEILEKRVDNLEISTNLLGWLVCLEERDYFSKIPTKFMRLIKIINDFYMIKNDNWNFNDLLFMRKAIRTVGIDPNERLSLNAFIDGLTDEIQDKNIGFEYYDKAITAFEPDGLKNYSTFVIDNISSPVFVSMHGLNVQYRDRRDVVEILQDQMNCTTGEALKILLKRSIENLNVNLNYEFPIGETSIEILGCLRLSKKLALASDSSARSPAQKKTLVSNVTSDKINITNAHLGVWQTYSRPECREVECVQFSGNKFYASFRDIYGRSSLNASSDLANWEHIFDFSKHEEFVDEIFNVNGELVCKYGNCLIYSPDNTNFETFELPTQFHGSNISYKTKNRNHIFKVGNCWYVVGMYSKSSNSKGIVIYYGNNFSRLDIAISSDELSPYSCDDYSFAIYDNSLCLFAKDYSTGSSKLISLEGSSISKEIKFSNHSSLNSIMQLNDKLFFCGRNSIALKDDSQKKIKNIGFKADFENFEFVSENSANDIAFMSKNDKLIITNDFISFKQLDKQFKFYHNFTYGNNLLAIYTNRFFAGYTFDFNQNSIKYSKLID